jgi:hypothetical protein
VSSGSTTHDLESAVGADEAATSAGVSKTVGRLRLKALPRSTMRVVTLIW